MDEFSDFQMAVQKPNPTVVSVGMSYGNNVPPGKTSAGIRFPDSSPVHSFASHSKADVVRSQFSSKPVVPPAQKFGTNVGSRLANYDLGLSVPPSQQHQQNNSHPGGDLWSAPKTISSHPVVRNANQDSLLIGDEDRYSALRMLTEDIATSIFERPAQKTETTTTPVIPSNNNSTQPTTTTTNHSSGPAFNCNLTSALEFSSNVESAGGDPSSDFGDFQSFTGFQSGLNNQTNQSNVLPHSNTTISSFDNFKLTPIITTKIEPPALPVENGCCDSDAEFGDFVSVEPVIPIPSPMPPAPNPPAQPVNWKHNHFDLASLTLTPPEETKTESQPNFESVLDLDLTYLSSTHSTTDNDLSYQKEEPPQQQQRADSSSVPFSNFDAHKVPEQQGQVLDWFQTEDLKPSSTIPPSLTPSSFIRTSLIRNDEVTDIDVVKWNQSEDSNNDCTLEYTSSFERKDFGKSKFLDVSPETRSIASLDLGNYVTVDYSDANKSLTDAPTPPNHVNLKSSTSAGTPPAPLHMPSDEPIMYDDYDKYQCFREECDNEKERYSAEWRRCLKASKTVIANAFSVFNGASKSEVIKEVVADEKGYSYVMNILDVYRLTQRIQKSSERVGNEGKVRNAILEINNLWETLTAFLLGTCVSTEICQESKDCDYSEPRDSLPSCGVCLCTVEVKESTQFLDYGGKIYHCKCANFWVNEVDAILPSLSYVFNSNSSSSSNQLSKSDKNSLV